jgi:endoglucanase
MVTSGMPRLIAFFVLVMSWTCAAFAAGEVLWSAPMGAPLQVELNDKTTSALRTMDVPAEALRGKWVYLSAKVKGAEISAKPQDWNGVKVMLKIDGAAGEQWPQIGVPAGTFEWETFSTRILIPREATKLTLHLGLELVTGAVWFDEVRITLARETREVPAAPVDQPIFKGHALPALRGAMAHPEMKREDLRVFAEEWGGNLIRWQLLHLPQKGSEKDYEVYDRWLEKALLKLDDVLAWSKEFGVKVVVDLHSPPGGKVGGGWVATASGDFWSTPASQEHFLKTWRRIAERYKDEHDVIWGFDLLNEPDDRTVTEAGDDWQTLAGKAAKVVREVDPRRTLIVEPAMSGSADGFIGFEPLDVPNVVYSFHMYSTFNYTHQGVDRPDPAITYPGEVGGQRWDKAALEKSMEAAIAFAKKYRVHLYVGEFSTIRWAPGAADYLRDAIEIFEKHGWDWSYHAFREWHGWNLELGTDRDDMTPTKEPGERLKALLEWTRKNRSGKGKRFPADAVMDITKPPYGAWPDDGVDDTAAIQRAITDCTDTGRFIYFPAGVYEISETLVSKNKDGLWWAMVTMQGEDRERTVLRLKDNAAGFGDATKPKAMLMTGSIQGPGDDATGGGNKAFRNYVMDLTIDTGRGNAGAIGIEWAASNWGSIKDVTIRSGDGAGHAGLSMRRNIPGPGYVNRVSIEGFDYGIDVGEMQYGFTLEHVQVSHQRKAGVRLDRNLLHVRRLISDNAVPAAVTTHAESVLTLVDSDLRGTAEGVNALEVGGNRLLADVRLNPAAAITVRGKTEPVSAHHAGVAAKLTLPVEDAPEYWNADLSDWAAVGARKEGEPDDTAAIQRAMDAGKATVYFPIGKTYFVSDTISVRGAVRQVLGMGAEISLGAAEKPFSDAENPRPLFRIEDTAGHAVVFEHLFFNAQYRGVVIFENDSPKTVVIRHSGGWIGTSKYRRSYQNTARATGRVFVEDVFMSGWNFENQTVWARQFNPENQDGDGVEPQVRNAGGRLWILGFKTEGQAPFIVTENGATTELLGAYNYVSATHPPVVPVEAVPYVVKDAKAFLSFTTENFRDSDYRVYVRETQGGTVREWTREEMPPRNGAPGYRSFYVPGWALGEEKAK